MVSLLVTKSTEGISVESEMRGTATDIGIEALHLIAVLMSEVKKDSESVHAAILASLAECPAILLGDYTADECRNMGDMN